MWTIDVPSYSGSFSAFRLSGGLSLWWLTLSTQETLTTAIDQCQTSIDGISLTRRCQTVESLEYENDVDGRLIYCG